MSITIKKADVHNLKQINVTIDKKVTVVTGVSGSGKSSFVFDTLYYEIKRRLFSIFGNQKQNIFIPPANVETIEGLKPAIAIDQNIINRNPRSTLASSIGIHALLRILFANFGHQYCYSCGNYDVVYSESQIKKILISQSNVQNYDISLRLVKNVMGSHKSLLDYLFKSYSKNQLIIDGHRAEVPVLSLKPDQEHSIEIVIKKVKSQLSLADAGNIITLAKNYGLSNLVLRRNNTEQILAFLKVCSKCGTHLPGLKPKDFNYICDYCKGIGCEKCNNTGLNYLAANVKWANSTLPDILKLSVQEFLDLLKNENDLPVYAEILYGELVKRLQTLLDLGLGYLPLSRSSPTLSRGEHQRVQLSKIMSNNSEDMLYILDEPSIGLHPSEIERILPQLRKLQGDLIYVEHDRSSILYADDCIEFGPGGGSKGGQIIFHENPNILYSDSSEIRTNYRKKKRTNILENKQIQIHSANARNLKNINLSFPLKAITVVTGVSGSGKSTLVNEVIVSSLNQKKPIHCTLFNAPAIKPVFVSQDPIGINSRSTPATYTGLFDLVRQLYAEVSGSPASYFSYNKEGACPECSGLGYIETSLRFLNATSIQCPSCNGKRYSKEVLSFSIDFEKQQLSIAQFLKLTVDEAYELLKLFKSPQNLTSLLEKINRILQTMMDIGLDYIQLGQPSPSLSGGEAQRIKLTKFIGDKNIADKLLILDEPTTGLHSKNIQSLISVLEKISSSGGTILIIEHNIDIIRSADWIIELGPGAGPMGGDLIYSGTQSDFTKCKASKTSPYILKESNNKIPKPPEIPQLDHQSIKIEKARANNLKNISVEIPKNQITVITGVSGSGKSTLVKDVIEAEAKRKFAESLTVYERYNINEIGASNVDSITGMGLVISVSSERHYNDNRSTVSTITGIYHYLNMLFASFGDKTCDKCENDMVKNSTRWICTTCSTSIPFPKPDFFSRFNYRGACAACHGVGTIQKLNEEKIVKDPSKPICNGALHSAGFFPKGFLCKPRNSGYHLLRALSKYYGFVPETTPWEDIPVKAREAFLYGDDVLLDVDFERTNGTKYSSKSTFPGFMGWIKDWDTGGTYSDHIICQDCNGSGLKKEFSNIRIHGYNIHELSELPISKIYNTLINLPHKPEKNTRADKSLTVINHKLDFLCKMGLGYINLNRPSYTLSEGEVQRTLLSTLISNELNNIIILLDEPTRGLHNQEIASLVDILKQTRNYNNTLIIIEHDPYIIQNADYYIELGPGAGVKGGRVITQSVLKDAPENELVLSQIPRHINRLKRARPIPKDFFIIKGAYENNLKIHELHIPLNMMVGICGVSGSGKSTLVYDTIGKAITKRKQSRSVEYEPIKKAVFESMEGVPKKVILIDQMKPHISHVGKYLGIENIFQEIYALEPNSKMRGYDIKTYSRNCPECNGKGTIKIDMGFLPDSNILCEACQGSGYNSEAGEVSIKGISLPDLFCKTLEEIYHLWKDDNIKVRQKLKPVIDVGLGYLTCRQSSHSISTGEAQRLKLASELSTKSTSKTLYIFDEPTTGLHIKDVVNLLSLFHKLVEKGNSVWIVEHHLTVLAHCDYLIELGPKGGPEGGVVIAEGLIEDIIDQNTATLNALKNIVKK